MVKLAGGDFDGAEQVDDPIEVGEVSGDLGGRVTEGFLVAGDLVAVIGQPEELVADASGKVVLMRGIMGGFCRV